MTRGAMRLIVEVHPAEDVDTVVELFDATQPESDAELVNISSRAVVGNGLAISSIPLK